MRAKYYVTCTEHPSRVCENSIAVCSVPSAPDLTLASPVAVLEARWLPPGHLGLKNCYHTEY